MDRRAMRDYLMEEGADGKGMKVISDAVISSISSAKKSHDGTGLSAKEEREARMRADEILDGAFACCAGSEGRDA